MKPHTMQERVQLYADSEPGQKWPASTPYVGPDGRLYGMWILGNNYRNVTPYHGSYPPNYLVRAMALFPDAERVLHLFSGSLRPGPYTRFDLRDDVDCDVRGDAHQLASHFPNQTFDCIYADPPYTGEDANAYGTAMVNRNTIIRQVYEILEPGGFLVWLDMVLPMFRKVELELAGVIGMGHPLQPAELAPGDNRLRAEQILAECLEKVSALGFRVTTELSSHVHNPRTVSDFVLHAETPCDLAEVVDELGMETAGVLGLVRSTNHRFRCAVIFRKL